MTRLSPTLAPIDSPSRDGQHPTSTGDATADRIAGWEERLRDAEQCANKAQQRAREAEQRAQASERRVDALLRALDTRGPIDQAKGVVMCVFDLDPDAAYKALVWVSQNANVKLIKVVERFLNDVRGLDLRQRPREELTSLMAAMARPDGQHFT